VCVLLYHDLYNGRGFSPIQESWKRYRQILELARSLGMLERIPLLATPLATEEELQLAHPLHYIHWVREQERAGTGFFDRSTPIWPGLYDRARATVGASVLGARLIGAGATQSAINLSGGLHHAHAERASGFCLFNDVVIAVRVLQREFGLERIAIVDIDGHHGDGTQTLLYREPILYVSLHRHDGRFYPGTGSQEERGEGHGLGYTVNVPLPRNCGDEAYLRAMHEIVEPAVCAYRPQCILLQYGVDGHFADAMVRLGLTTHAYAHCARLIRHLADRLCGGRLLIVGGGGYRPQDAVRCWAFLLGELADLAPVTIAHLHDQPPLPAPTPEAQTCIQQVIAQARADQDSWYRKVER
jgi:acetoin utilization protein AcuC